MKSDRQWGIKVLLDFTWLKKYIETTIFLNTKKIFYYQKRFMITF